MTRKFFTMSALSLMTAAMIFAAAPARAEMTEADVQRIVEQYLMDHPETILKSVDSYQRKTMETRSTDAIKRNNDDLFRDQRSPFIGSEKADVVIVEFFDYNCGYCKKAFPELKSVVDGDKKLKVIFKDLPILGPTSETAAKWALAAHMQGKYFEFHQAMMKHQGPITDDVLEKAAKEAGADVAKIKTDMNSTDVTVQIEKNKALANQMGISGTPAFVIGQEVIPGAVPKETIEQKIAEVRKNAATDKKDGKK